MIMQGNDMFTVNKVGVNYTVDLNRGDAYGAAEYLNRFYFPVSEVKLSFTTNTGKILLHQKDVLSRDALESAMRQYEMFAPKI